MSMQSPTNGPTNAELERVHWDNVRANQIGGEFDGITEEVATDIGFLPLKEAVSNDEGPVSGIPAEARAGIESFRAGVQAKRDAGELPPKGTGADSDLGATAKHVMNRGMPFHAPPNSK